MAARYIGVDIGGTRTKLARLQAPGEDYQFRPEDCEFREIDSGCAGAADLVAAIAAATHDWRAADQDRAIAVGVAVPGLVQRASGRVIETPNLPILNDFPLAEALQAATGLPARVDNDANAAGLAEAVLGAARGCDIAVCFTVGTGVGAAITRDGRLWRGHGGMAGELGRSMIDDSMEPFEAGVGAAAVVAGYRERGGALPDGGSADVVSQRADAGDQAARDALAACGARLGVGLGLVVNLLNPQRIVIGGGVACAGEWFLGPAREEALRRAWAPIASQCDIVAAQLGPMAGAVGAALLGIPGAR